VLDPSKSERHPAARCSAVSDVPPEAVLLLADCVLLAIGVHAKASNASWVMIAARAAGPRIMASSR
jgi:hypothetical protein